MALTLYTSYDEIRAALGVSTDELEDATLALPLYLTELQESLYAINTAIETDFLALSAPTGTSLRFSNLMKAYCTYFVAQRLITSLPVFAPKMIKDQHAEQQRIDDPFKTIRGDIAENLSYIKSRLLIAYAVVNPSAILPTAAARVNVLSTGLGLDPVTGV